MTLVTPYVQRVDPTMFGAKQPIDAAQAWMIQQNLYCLIQQGPQCILNFCGLVSASDSSLKALAVADTTYLYPFTGLQTWIFSDRPCSLKLMVWARTQATIANITLRARVIPDVGPPGYEGVDALIDDSVLVTSSSVSSTPTLEVHGRWPASPFMQASWRSYPAVENGVAISVLAAALRLELSLYSDVTDGGESPNLSEIVSAQLWGFS